MKKLFYLLLALPMMLAACEEAPVNEPTGPNTPDGPDGPDVPVVEEPKLTLTSETTLSFSEEGGEGVITYTLENKKEDVELSATCEAEWVSAPVVGETITFTVSANDGEARQTKVVVAYDTQSFEVAIAQSAKVETPAPTPNVVEFEAQYFVGQYYGSYYTPTAGNYYVHLSDIGFDETGDFVANGQYITLDIYAPLYEGEESSYVPLPIGTYNLDENGTMAQWTIDHRYSAYTKTDGTADGDGLKFDEAQLVVTENDAVFTGKSGEVTYRITFTGEAVIANVEVEKPEEVIFEASESWCFYYGDYYNPGVADDFYLFFSDLGVDADGYEVANGKYYRFDVYTTPIDKANGIALPYGMYLIDPSESMQPNSISYSASLYYIMDEYGEEVFDGGYINSGYLLVDETGIHGEFSIGGVKHVISYEGAVEYIDVTDQLGDDEPGDGGDEPDGDYYSTLTSDYACKLDNHTLYYEYYGDYYEIGFRNWTFALIPNTFVGDTVQFDILASPTSYQEFFGDYTVTGDKGAFTALPGTIEDGYMSYSWYYTEDGMTMAPFVEGTLSVSPATGADASVTFEVKDDRGNTISGSWSGSMLPASALQSTRSSVVFRSK